MCTEAKPVQTFEYIWKWRRAEECLWSVVVMLLSLLCLLYSLISLRFMSCRHQFNISLSAASCSDRQLVLCCCLFGFALCGSNERHSAASTAQHALKTLRYWDCSSPAEVHKARARPSFSSSMSLKKHDNEGRWLLFMTEKHRLHPSPPPMGVEMSC